MLGRFRLLAVLEWALIVLLSSLVIIVFLNVMLRMFFDAGIAAAEELSRLMLVWLVILGAALTLARQAHISMDALVVRLPAPVRFVVAVVGLGLMMMCDSMLMIGAMRQYQYSSFDTFPITGLPVGIVYQAGITGAGLFLLVSGWRLLGLLTGRVSASEHFSQHRSLPEGQDALEEEEAKRS